MAYRGESGAPQVRSVFSAGVETADPSAPRITTIDISRPARILALLRWSDAVLVLGCGFGALGVLPDLLMSLAGAQWVDALVQGVLAASLAFAAYTGWRHVGVVDPRVWRAYLWVFPLLTAVSGFLALSIAATGFSQGARLLENPQSVLLVVTILAFAGVAIPGFICVVVLRHMRIPAAGEKLQDLLLGLQERGGSSGLSLTRRERTGFHRGLIYGAVGLTILLGTTFAPLPVNPQQASNVLRLSQQLNLVAFFLIVRARRYFQVSADALLAVDRRPPILFLRSFADDERQQYSNSQRALLDFSLETRLANHFYRFGPFIAIGSPKETVPQLGAARVLLRDDEWQGRVLGWMKDASVIIMYCGTTHWVNWELSQVIGSGRATSLILMFPEIKGWRASRRKRAIAERVEQLRAVFQDTPWSDELQEFSDHAGVRAMLFRADGSAVIVRSRSRSRDAYHLAALVAHHQLLAPGGAAKAAVTVSRWPRPVRWLAVAGALGAVAASIAAGVYLLAQSGDARLSFNKGELYFHDPVTAAEARGVGDYLVRQQFFGEAPRTVQLHRQQGLYRLNFVVDSSHADDVLAGIEFGMMGREIGRDVLGGKPIEIALVDVQLKPLKTVPSSARLAFGRGELYFTAPATETEATAVGQLLVQSGFFSDDRETSVHFSREASVYQLRFVVDPARATDPEIRAAFRELGKAVAAQALGGRLLVVHLCDDHFRSVARESS
ncbi:MAG: hypothetical protein ACM36C_11490 [Acidobacteriota bacterium]